MQRFVRWGLPWAAGLWSGTAWATSSVACDVSEAFATSDVVVDGVVVARRFESLPDAGGFVVTVYTLTPTRVWGADPTAPVDVVVPGGKTEDGHWMVLEGLPPGLRPGERVVLALDHHAVDPGRYVLRCLTEAVVRGVELEGDLVAGTSDRVAYLAPTAGDGLVTVPSLSSCEAVSEIDDICEEIPAEVDPVEFDPSKWRALSWTSWIDRIGALRARRGGR